MALQIIRNNIINVEADAIVNTANPAVGVGRGVDQAIYEAAGWDELLEAREKIGEILPGEAACTPAFDLHAKYIIHTVGPAWRGGGFGERETVAKCYSGSLELASELGCESIAFPLIATGTYGFPKDEALRIAMSEISRFLLAHEMEVLLVVYDKESFEVSGKLFSDIKSFIEDREAAYDTLFHSYGQEEIYGRGLPESGGPELAKSAGRKSTERNLPESSGRKSAERNLPEPSGRRGLLSRFKRPKRTEEPAERTLMEEAPSIDAEYDLMADEAAAEYEKSYSQIPMESLDLEIMPEPAYPRSYSPAFPSEEESLEERLKHLDKTFQQYLFMLIDRRGLSDPDVYNKANIDRKHFSKIRSNADYTPSKKTALALAIALELSIDETKDLLARAGLALSPSKTFDRIIEYCIETSNYDIYEINCILFKYDQPTLGA